MVISGSLCTMCAKWSDLIEADGVHFNHPFLQAAAMFFGMLLCMGAYFIHMFYRKYKRNKGKGSDGAEEEPIIPQFNPFVFLLPAVCDIVATCILYVGLNLTTASSYQMLQGALIVCTGLLSIFLVNARIQAYKWIGMFIVVLGLVVVGVTDFLYGEETDEKKEGAMIGNILCVVAQIAVALQLVLEQKYLHMHDVHPLFAVGLEGIYGLVILGIGMVPLYYIHVPPTFSSNPEGRLEDVIYAWKQICMEPMIAVSLAAMIISIAFFNFSAISVTKELTATTRTVIDSIRTIVIWGASIPLFHEKFIPYQILGFFLLVLGMFIHNDILIGPWFRRTFLPSPDKPDHSCFATCCFKFWGTEQAAKQARAETIRSEFGRHV